MKTFLIVVLVFCTAPPFAFYTCYAAVKGKSITTPFIKAFGALIIMVFALALASIGGVDVDWSNVLGILLRCLTSRWKAW